MDASKMHVIMDIKDEFQKQGKDNGAIAEIMHKDKSVVDKQFAEKNGTQTLLTAYGYAEAAGGRIIFMLDEEWERLQAIEKEYIELQEAIRDRDRRLSNMSETAKSMAIQIAANEKTIARLEAKIDEKEKAIDRKDGVIADLLRKNGIIT